MTVNITAIAIVAMICATFFGVCWIACKDSKDCKNCKNCKNCQNCQNYECEEASKNESEFSE